MWHDQFLPTNVKLLVATIALVAAGTIAYGLYHQEPKEEKQTTSISTQQNNANMASKGTYQWKVIRVLDGDTIEVDAKFFPTELGNIEIRVRGVDTPEKAPRAKCESEAQLAKKASQFAKDTLLGKTITVTSLGQDKYGGRVVAVVTIDGKTYSEMLIERRLAVPYEGKTKQSWC